MKISRKIIVLPILMISIVLGGKSWIDQGTIKKKVYPNDGTRLATKEEVQKSVFKRAMQDQVLQRVERPMQVAKEHLDRQKYVRPQQHRKPELNKQKQKRVQKALRYSSRWQDWGRRSGSTEFGIPSVRLRGAAPTVLVNDLAAATIDAGDAFTVTVTLTDSAKIDLFFDANGDTVVDGSDLSLFGFLFPFEDDLKAEGPFWIFDNDAEDEDPTVGVFKVTVDDFPYMGLDVIMQVTDAGGSGQAYLTVNNLSGTYTAGGTVTPATDPVLILFGFGEKHDPWFTFTDGAVFSFGFSGAKDWYMIGAMNAYKGIETGQYLFRMWFMEDPDSLSGLTLDITRDAAVKGTVNNAADNVPISGMGVGAMSFSFYEGIFAYTLSGTDGSFTVPLHGGKGYHVGTHHPEFMESGCLDFPLYVNAGDTVLADCEVEPWPAFIEGIVTDAVSSQPLVDIDIEIFIWDDMEPGDGMGGPGDGMGGPGDGKDDDGPMGMWNDTWTDENGHYRLGSIMGEGVLCAFDWEDNQYGPVCIKPFVVDEALETQDFQLRAWEGLITGVVRDSVTQAPIEGADVWVFHDDDPMMEPMDPMFFFGGWDYTGPDGVYAIPVMFGTYVVCSEQWHEGYHGSCEGGVEVSASTDTVQVDLDLSPPDGMIEGYVKDELNSPLAGIGVAAHGWGPGGYTETDENGYYSMGVDNGQYELCFFDWSRTYYDTCLTDIVVNDNTVTLPDVNLITIDYDGALKGSVSDADGNPVVSFVVAVDTSFLHMEPLRDEHDKFGMFFTVTDRNGQYLLPVMNGGYVSMAVPFDEFHLPAFTSDISIQDDTVTVDFVTPIFVLDAVIRGTVKDSTGAPIDSAWVAAATWLGLGKDLGWHMGFDTDADDNGQFSIDVMGFSDRSYWIHGEAWDGEHFLVGGADSISVQSGDTAQVDLVLKPIIYAGAIFGRVTFEGNPVPGIPVVAEHMRSGDFFETHTDDNGYYEMGVRNGGYEVCVPVDPDNPEDDWECEYAFVESNRIQVNIELGFGEEWIPNMHGNFRFLWGPAGFMEGGEFPAGSGTYYLAEGGLVIMGYTNNGDTLLGGAVYDSWYPMMDDFNARYHMGMERINRTMIDVGWNRGTHLAVNEVIVTGDNEDYVLIGTEVLNPGNRMFTGVKAGYFMDWDVAYSDSYGDSYNDDMSGMIEFQIQHPVHGNMIPVKVSYMADDDGDGGASPGFVGMATLPKGMHGVTHINIDLDLDDPVTTGEYVGIMDPGMDSEASTSPADYAVMQLHDAIPMNPDDSYRFATVLMAADSPQGFETLLNQAVARISEVLLSLDDPDALLPKQYALYQNFPNPFNPATTIRFDLVKSGYVELSIYNVLGQEITRLVDEIRPAGRYTVPWDASRVPSGLYLYQIRSKGYVETRKMMLLK